MKPTRDKPTFLHINRVQSATKIASLLSWRSLRELPWVFRILFLMLGIALISMVIGLVIAVLTAPLWFWE